MYRSRPDLGAPTYPFRVRTLRRMTLFALVAYPLGAILRIAGGEIGLLGGVVGNLLTFAAIMVMFVCLGSTVSELVGNESGALDEYQRGLRTRAFARSYGTLFCLICGSFTYLYFAFEFGFWTPSDAEQWQAIAMGFILATMLLPTTLLVWLGDVDDVDSQNPASEEA